NGLARARTEDEYQLLRTTMLDFLDLGAACDKATYHPHENGNTVAHSFEPGGREQRIDYIFYRAPFRGTHWFEPRAFERVLDRRLSCAPPHDTHPADPAHAYASDH